MKLGTTPISGANVLLALLLLLSGCDRFQGGSTTNPVAATGLPAEGTLARVPLGQLSGVPTLTAAALSTANPYQDNAHAIEQGKELYIKMNCAGCHAYNGKGNMGPNLTDSHWRYGGLPIQVYMTIRDGRPNGMPAWGLSLPPDEIWKIVAYIQSLGGTVAVSGYEHARQGDQPGEQITPEAQADAQVDSPPPAIELPKLAPVEPTASAAPDRSRHSATPPAPKQPMPTPAEKAGQPPL